MAEDIYSFRGICNLFVSTYNKTPEKPSFTVRVRTLCSSYAEGKDLTKRPIWEKLCEAIQEGENQGLWNAKTDRDGNYTTLSATASQALQMASVCRFTTWPKYLAVLDNCFALDMAKHPVISKWVEKEVREGYPDCRKWWPCKPSLSLSDLKGELTRTINTVDYILGLKKETLVRNLSVQVCGGSKEFSRIYESRVCRFLRPDSPASTSVEREAILAEYLVVKNPSQAILRGSAQIKFHNGSELRITPDMGHPAMSAAMIEQLSHIRCQSLLTIENLTTFHDYPAESGEFLICTMGQPNHAVTNLIGFVLKSNQMHGFEHYGDLDGFGFAIIETLHKRTGATVRSRHMDVGTYLENLECGVPLNDRNIPLIQRLLEEDCFDEEQKRSMRMILRKKVLVEQESIDI